MKKQCGKIADERFYEDFMNFRVVNDHVGEQERRVIGTKEIWEAGRANELR